MPARKKRFISEGPNPGEYVITEADGTVIRVGRNPDVLATWGLYADSGSEIVHDYDCSKWEKTPWPRPH